MYSESVSINLSVRAGKRVQVLSFRRFCGIIGVLGEVLYEPSASYPCGVIGALSEVLYEPRTNARERGSRRLTRVHCGYLLNQSRLHSMKSILRFPYLN